MKFHDELNPKLWDNFYLKKDVSDKLGEIAEVFIKYLDIPTEAIKDIRITGSSANYNYTPHSDIDLHILVDYEEVHEDCPLVEGYLWSLKSQFNKEHDITIHGIPVEVYAEDSTKEAISNGVYSLVTQDWIKKPEKIEPTDNDGAVEAKYNELKEAVDRCEDSETAQELLDKIYQMRKSGLSTGGEFSTENLAFKRLRDSCAIDELKAIKKAHIDESLSLNSRVDRISRVLASYTEEPDAFEDNTKEDWLNQEKEEDKKYYEQEKARFKDRYKYFESFTWILSNFNKKVGKQLIQWNEFRNRKIIQVLFPTKYAYNRFMATHKFSKRFNACLRLDFDKKAYFEDLPIDSFGARFINFYIK